MSQVAAPGLFLRHFGQGPHPALLLHCGMGSSAMWKGVASGLADRLAMVAPDLPGHGRSPGFAPTGDVHDQACAALRPLMRDGIHLVGHSFGATLALRLALEDAGRVASLTLVEPVFFAAARGTPAFAAHQAEASGFARAFADGQPLLAARLFNRVWGGGVPWDRFAEPIQHEMARQMRFVMATVPSLWDDCHQMLRPGGLESLTCPVALLRGGDTVPVIADVHRALMARLPDASQTVVPGAGHMLVTSHAGAVAQAVLAVLEKAEHRVENGPAGRAQTRA